MDWIEFLSDYYHHKIVKIVEVALNSADIVVNAHQWGYWKVGIIFAIQNTCERLDTRRQG